MRYLIACAVVLGLGGYGFADTYTVCPSGCDYTSIQDAIDASSDDDVIQIEAGTFNEHTLNPGGKAITIQGTLNSDGSLATSIDAQQGGKVFLFDSDEESSTVIQNLVITGGYSTYGGGIRCQYNSSPSITNCVITGNTATSQGGGMYIGSYGYSSTPTITNCIILNNTVALYGGGIALSYSNCTITGCTISGNSATSPDYIYAGGGGIFNNHSSPTITDCTISNNFTSSTGRGNNPSGYGGGICSMGVSNPSIINCRLSNNVANLGGGLCCWEGQANLSGTLVCGNEPNSIYGSWVDNGGNEVVEECPSFVGACCTNDICLDAEEYDCVLYGGQWMGEGSTCDDCPPPSEPEVFGACCVNGTCVRTTSDDCFTGGGSYAGDEVDCIDADCPSACLGDVTGDGEVNVNDLLIVIANWNNCP